MTICTRTFIWLTWLMGATMAMPLLAQTAVPSAEQMIEQLKAPRTRSLRNLTVEAVPAISATADAAHASAGTPPTAATPVSTVAQSAVNRPSLSLLIQFDFDSARVRPESQQALANLSQALQSTELVSSRFAVEGHTDAKGGADYNLKLSESRAQAVRDFLKSKGIDPNRLVPAGKGATELANSSQPFAPENRRVRIVNLD
jgi:outer membrane protein OmpA-like peptidoglycan-associated protein